MVCEDALYVWLMCLSVKVLRLSYADTHTHAHPLPLTHWWIWWWHQLGRCIVLVSCTFPLPAHWAGHFTLCHVCMWWNKWIVNIYWRWMQREALNRCLWAANWSSLLIVSRWYPDPFNVIEQEWILRISCFLHIFLICAIGPSITWLYDFCSPKKIKYTIFPAQIAILSYIIQLPWLLHWYN